MSSGEVSIRVRMTFSPRLGPVLGVHGVEDDPARGRAGTGVEALGQEPAALDGRVLLLRVEDRPEELVELVGLDPAEGLLLVDELLADHVDRDLDRGEGRPLARPGTGACRACPAGS